MAKCDFCERASYNWVHRSGKWQQVEFKPATKSFLCSRCVQVFLRMPEEEKVVYWKHFTLCGDETRARWLGHFIREEVLRNERRGLENKRFLHGGHLAGRFGVKESDIEQATVGKTISLYQRDPDKPSLSSADSLRMASGK